MSAIQPSRTPSFDLTPHGVSMREAFFIWLRVAALSFGGPAGQIAVMHRILVDEKRWVSESRFLHALNYCMLLPGPEAQQLAIYIGWLMHRTAGGIMAGGLFILPGIVALMALSIVYAVWGQVGIVAGAFFGLNAAVLAIVADAVLRIGRRALKGRTLQALAALAFVAIFVFGVPFPLIIVTTGLAGFLAARAGHPDFVKSVSHGPGKTGPGVTRPDGDSLLGEAVPAHAKPSAARALRVVAVWLPLWIAPTLALALIAWPGDVYATIALVFSKLALVTFGGAYAVLVYVAQQAVETYHWLAPREMLDGLGMAETTPGPLVMVLQFVGFMAAFRAPGPFSPLVAGVLGGLLATWVTFVPCFLWIFLGAPYIEQLRGNRLLAGALSAITAAVAGVILNLAVWFAIHSLFRATRRIATFGLQVDMPILGSVDPWHLVLVAAAMLMIFWGRISAITTLAVCGVAGIVLQVLDFHASGLAT